MAKIKKNAEKNLGEAQWTESNTDLVIF